MDEKNLDLKPEDKTSDGTGQPEEKKPLDSPETGDDKVVLSKEEHQKLLEDRENYKQGLLSYKEKAKDKPEEKSSEDVLTKKDFQKINEKKAVEAFIKDNPEVKDRWKDFVSFYRDASGRDTVEDIVKDLDDAKTLFLKHNPLKGDDGKEVKADLSSDKSLPSGSSSDDGKPSEGGGILKKGKPIQEWY